MIIRSKHFIFPFLALTAVAFIYITDRLTVETALISLGIISLTYIVFILSSAVRAVKTDAGESIQVNQVVYKSSAIHTIDDKPVKGSLCLMKDRLIFKGRKAEVTILLNDVTDVSFAKLYNSLDRRIIIGTKNGSRGFLVKGNLLWIEEIENALL